MRPACSWSVPLLDLEPCYRQERPTRRKLWISYRRPFCNGAILIVRYSCWYSYPALSFGMLLKVRCCCCLLLSCCNTTCVACSCSRRTTSTSTSSAAASSMLLVLLRTLIIEKQQWGVHLLAWLVLLLLVVCLCCWCWCLFWLHLNHRIL